jgi:hypothetical protein
MTDTETQLIETLRGQVARERVIRHLVAGGVDPEYAEFHVAKQGEFRTNGSEVTVNTAQGWKSGDAALKEYAAQLLKSVPSKFHGKGEDPADVRSDRYDAVAAGKAAAEQAQKQKDQNSLAFR